MNELVKRSIFGLLYVGLMLTAVMSESSTIFLLVFSFLGFVGICEYSSLVGVHRTRPLRVILDGLAVVYLLSLSHGSFSLGGLLPYALYILYCFVRSMYSGRGHQPEDLAKVLFGQIYVGLPLAVASMLHDSLLLRSILLITLVCIWANDTGAFVFGSRFGKHRLFPSLSPKKSWEGFVGGLLTSMLASVLVSYYVIGAEITYVTFVTGALVSVAATWGDLFESMLKRNAGVKDSGYIIPGHGGVLDRIDSILFAVPIVSLFYLYLLASLIG